MKQLVIIAALLVVPLNAYADKKQECNIAIDKIASYLRSQSAVIDKTDNIKDLSRDEIEAMIAKAQNIVDEGERMINLCDLDQEMTEGVIDLIINNKAKIEKLTHAVKEHD